jgi:hypothetical protein
MAPPSSSLALSAAVAGFAASCAYADDATSDAAIKHEEAQSRAFTRSIFTNASLFILSLQFTA